ncbi:hypothetical protein Dimus_031988 [Dionaea muscipula]
MDATRKKYRNRMKKMRAENNRLKEELTSEKSRLIELASASFQLKADVVQGTKESQMVEEVNKKLKADLEKEKEKEKRLRERIVMLHNDFYDKTLKNDRLNNELNETYQKLTKMEIDVKAPFSQEKIPKIEKKPTELTEAYDVRALTFIEDWGKEIEEIFQMSSMSDMLNIALQALVAPVPEAPSASDAPLLTPAAPTTTNAPPASDTSLPSLF